MTVDQSRFLNKDEFFAGVDFLGFRLSYAQKESLWDEIAANTYNNVLTQKTFKEALKAYYDE